MTASAVCISEENENLDLRSRIRGPAADVDLVQLAGAARVGQESARDRCLRECVAELMVAVHQIAIELAEYHAAQMDERELLWRLRKYSEMELSVVGAKNRADPISTRFLDTRQRRHASRHSTLFPSSRPSKRPGKDLPELEVKNRVRSRSRAKLARIRG